MLNFELGLAWKIASLGDLAIFLGTIGLLCILATQTKLIPMKWYHYIACFFAGMFLANAVPHFIHGVSGDVFPTPFSSPPGKGPSSPTTNVLWGLFNAVVGYLLYRGGKVSRANKAAIVICFFGALVMSIMLSYGFQDKMTH